MIKMKTGTFGLPVNGIVKAMTKDSGPFKASEEQEARLVKLGLAEYVGETPVEIPNGQPDEVETEEDEAPVKPLEDMTANELRALGKEYGLTFKAGTTKAEMVEAIKAECPVPADEATEDDGEGAPTFDASEAVQ